MHRHWERLDQLAPTQVDLDAEGAGIQSAEAGSQMVSGSTNSIKTVESFIGTHTRVFFTHTIMNPSLIDIVPKIQCKSYATVESKYYAKRYFNTFCF